MNGKGIYKWNDGDSFEGTFKDDSFVNGKLTNNKNGIYFVGDFKNDEAYNGKWYKISNNTVHSVVADGVETTN